MMTLSLTPSTLTSRGQGLLAFATSLFCFLAPLKRAIAESGQHGLEVGCKMLTLAIKVARDRPVMSDLQTTIFVLWSPIDGPAQHPRGFQGCSQPLALEAGCKSKITHVLWSLECVRLYFSVSTVITPGV